MATQTDHLAERDAHFKRRLEAFSDIVFGLSLSELALQLGLPKNPQELIASPVRYVIFFGSFAIVCSLWLGHHRMFRTFVVTPLALFLNFAYLAFTVLMPFGMQALLKFPGSWIGIAVYLVCYAGTAATMCGLLILGLRNGSAQLTPDERLRVETNLLRYAVLFGIMLMGLIILPLGGANRAGVSLFAIVPAMLATRLWVAAVQRRRASQT